MANIFYPKKYNIKPPAGASINWGHPLAQGLVWFALPGADHRRELVTGGLANTSQPITSTYTGSTPLGLGFESTNVDSGNIYYPWTEKLTEVTNRFTVVVWARVDTLSAYSHLFCIPYGSTWANPYFAIQMLRDNTTANLCLAWTVGGSPGTALGTTNGFLVNSDKFAMFSAATDTAGVTRFYKNGRFGESATRGGGGGTVDWGSKREVILMNHNSNDLFEGIDGVVSYAALWKRQLSDMEMSWLYQDPFAFMVPQYPHSFYSVSAAAAARIDYLSLLGVG